MAVILKLQIYLLFYRFINVYRNSNGIIIFLYYPFNGYSSFYFVATVFYGYSDSFTVKVYCSEHQNLYGFTLEPLNYKLYTCGLFLLWPKYIPYEKITIYFFDMLTQIHATGDVKSNIFRMNNLEITLRIEMCIYNFEG